MTISKQQIIDSLQKDLDQAYSRISQMQKDADDNFKNSPLYREMSERIRFYELVEQTKMFELENSIKRESRSIEESRMLFEDNAALCNAHDIDYWIGISDINRWNKNNIRSLEKEIETLKAKVEARDIVIEHLKDVIAGKDIDAPVEKVMGRKPVPKETIQRIKKYRREGYAVREIARLEGVSIGFVSQVCKGIKKREKKI